MTEVVLGCWLPFLEESLVAWQRVRLRLGKEKTRKTMEDDRRPSWPSRLPAVAVR